MTTLAQPFPAPPLGEDIVVIREKLKVTHLDPNSRRTYREFALRNDAQEARHAFLFVLEDSLVGLRIEDGEGRALVYLSDGLLESEVGPRDEILALVAPERDVAEPDILLVLFAEPLLPGATLVLRLHYWDRESHGSHWYDVVPKHWFEQAKSKTSEYFDTEVEIEAPSDSRIVVKREKSLRQPGVNQRDRSNFLEVRLPAGLPGVQFRYRVAPLAWEFWLTKLAYHALWSLPRSCSAWHGWASCSSEPIEPARRRRRWASQAS